MKVIGVTGGIGSGKSTVTQVLNELGAKIIDADFISKDIIYKDNRVLLEIISCFGNEILNDNGELDRKKLGNIVFSNAIKLSELEQITHKYIINEIVKQINVEKLKGSSNFIVLEASIPVEHGFKDLVDEIWVVITDREERIKRVMQRNAYSYDEVLKRINSQISDKEYLKIADKVIMNCGTKLELKNKIENIL